MTQVIEQIKVKEIEQGKEKRNVPKLRFKGFEDEWEKTKLGDLCILSSGSTPSKAKLKYFQGDNLWVTSGELKNKYVYDTIDKITDEAKRTSNLKTYDEETFVIAIYGLEAKGTRGSASILKKKATISQACMALETNSKLLSEYLYYWYEKNGDLIGIKYAQGTKQQNLSVDLVANLILKMPSLQEQKKIADFLSLVDKKIEKQSEKVGNLKTYKKGIMQKIFKQEIRFKDENGREYPEWQEKRLGEVGKVTTGSTPSTKETSYYGGEFLWASPSDLGENKYIYHTKTTLSDKGFKKVRIVEKESVLVTCIGSIGKLGIASMDMSTNQQINSIHSSNNNNEFIYYYLQYNFNKYLSYMSFQIMPIINKSQFENLGIEVPCLEEQTQIANFLSVIDKKIEKEEKKLEELRIWKKGLLQKMFV